MQHAECEFAVAFDRDDPRVRQALGGVALEFHALFEIYQIEFHLLGTAPQREVGDDDVKQSGLARAGFARDERVLASPLADR